MTPDLDALERAARAAKAADEALDEARANNDEDAYDPAYDAAATALNEMRNLADEDALLALIARVRTAEAENAATALDVFCSTGPATARAEPCSFRVAASNGCASSAPSLTYRRYPSA